MNYVHHALIGLGTAALGLTAAEALGAPAPPLLSEGMGAVLSAAGSIATDLDHPKSFISNSIPLKIFRFALAILLIPFLAALAALLTTRDLQGTWLQFSALVFGVSFLRWALIALSTALGLMLLSWFVYRSLHHRGPLHSILFTLAVTAVAGAAAWWSGFSWLWGLVFGWGWFWHVLADGLTEQGVPFYWPFSDERRHTLPVWACRLARGVLSLASAAGIIIWMLFHLSRALS